jgi:hypothetical protein
MLLPPLSPVMCAYMIFIPSGTFPPFSYRAGYFFGKTIRELSLGSLLVA